MARTGPNPPEMNWDRIDLRGINSTRHAWGYLSPDDAMIVNDQGKVYIRVDEEMLEKLPRKKGFVLRIVGKMASSLHRCLRWSKIVKELFEIEEDINFDDVEVIMPREKKPKLNFDRKESLKLEKKIQQTGITEGDAEICQIIS